MARSVLGKGQIVVLCLVYFLFLLDSRAMVSTIFDISDGHNGLSVIPLHQLVVR